MTKVKIPVGHQQVMPYLIVENAEQFLEFTKEVFDAHEIFKTMRDEHHIMHAEVMIGECTMMFADSTDEYGKQNAGLFVYVNDTDQVYQNALDHGATTVMEPADQSYGRSCGIKDPAGNTWWITSVG